MQIWKIYIMSTIEQKNIVLRFVTQEYFILTHQVTLDIPAMIPKTGHCCIFASCEIRLSRLPACPSAFISVNLLDFIL